MPSTFISQDFVLQKVEIRSESHVLPIGNGIKMPASMYMTGDGLPDRKFPKTFWRILSFFLEVTFHHSLNLNIDNFKYGIRRKMLV